MSIDKKNYLVLDIETNGLDIFDDILSISIYKPDDGTIYNKYLPLEISTALNPRATAINGITYQDLEGATPLSQDDVNFLFNKFELDSRIILTYGNFDKRMLRNYFKWHELQGFSRINFYNFKKEIISPRYSEGNITKDNLCRLLKIDGVQKTHSSANDCILEWKLFEKIEGKKLFITNNDVFELNSNYIIPVSFFQSHPNLKSYVPNLPYISTSSTLLKRFKISGKGISRFENNISGILIEHLINSMLEVQIQDSYSFLAENKKKLKYLGTLPSMMHTILLDLNKDGTVSAINPEDKKYESTFNESQLNIKRQLIPVVDYIAHDIFKDCIIWSQELVVNKNDNILALCDLSTENAVLEIKTSINRDISKYKNQLFYETNGRSCYLLQVDWSKMPKNVFIEISKIELTIGERPIKGGKQALSLSTVQSRIKNKNIEIIKYKSIKEPVLLKCTVCGHEWETSYSKATHNAKCPLCEAEIKAKRLPVKETISPAEKLKRKSENYQQKLSLKSKGCIVVDTYTGSRNQVHAKCLKCEYEWDVRADHLLDRPYCPHCKTNKH